MISQRNKLLYSALLLCLPSFVVAEITTLQSWDPMPMFNATNLNTPPDTQFCTIIKNKMIKDQDVRRRRFGLNFSPFIQRAIRAQGSNSPQLAPGQTTSSDSNYFGDYSLPEGIAAKPYGTEMSDYQGTPYLMGLFIGRSPVSGTNIWANGTDNGDTGNITGNSVIATGLPNNLQLAIANLNNLPTTNGITVTPGGNAGTSAIIYSTGSYTEGGTAYAEPSILSSSVLEQDNVLFGAFSVPLTYQKTGLRWEFNLDITDDFGIILQGGFAQISQFANNPIPLSAVTPPGPNPQPTIYSQLQNVTNVNASSTPTQPNQISQNTFEQWVGDNVFYLLQPSSSGGANYDVTTFSAIGLEDLRIHAFFRHPFSAHPFDDNNDYSPMIITPYIMAGVTIPLSGVKNYSKLYSLPFGNNGHYSAGGVAGITFDFIDMVEIGFELGATFFMEKEIQNLPCPTHILQRVIYPWRTNMNVQPGVNWHFTGTLNAIEFIDHVSFLFNYKFVQHMQDTLSLAPTQGQPTEYQSTVFFPYLLAEQSPWISQMFNATLVFRVQPGIDLSIGWQGALQQMNAYCSNTVMGSISFLF